jgi:hypothetical protein
MNVRIKHRKALVAAILDPFATAETIGAALDKSVVFPAAIDRFDDALWRLLGEAIVDMREDLTDGLQTQMAGR